MAEIAEIHAEVTFMIDEGSVDALKAKAAELDEDALDEAEGEYTLAQALQVVWHREPEWLHENGLVGWTLDKASEGSGPMRHIWGP
jgi:hypothetical protein